MSPTRRSTDHLLPLVLVLVAGAVVWYAHATAWDLGGRSPIMSYDSAQYALAARELAWHGPARDAVRAPRGPGLARGTPVAAVGGSAGAAPRRGRDLQARARPRRHRGLRSARLAHARAPVHELPHARRGGGARGTSPAGSPPRGRA